MISLYPLSSPNQRQQQTQQAQEQPPFQIHKVNQNKFKQQQSQNVQVKKKEKKKQHVVKLSDEQRTESDSNKNNATKDNTNSLFIQLPSEIISQIVLYLSVPDILSLSSTNSQLYGFISNHSTIWKSIYLKFTNAQLPRDIFETNYTIRDNNNDYLKKKKNEYNNNTNLTQTEQYNLTHKSNYLTNWKSKFIKAYDTSNNWKNGKYTVNSIECDDGGIFSLSFVSDLMATGSYTKALHLWRIENQTIRSVGQILGHSSWIWSVNMKKSSCFHSNICFSSSQDTSIMVTNIDKDEAFSYDQSSYVVPLSRSHVLKGHRNAVWTTLVDDSIQNLYTGSGDYSIKHWDVERYTLIGDVGRHMEAILCLSKTNESTMLASGSADHTVRLWDTRFPSKEIASIHEHSVSINSITVKDWYILSGGDDGFIRVADIRILPQLSYQHSLHTNGGRDSQRIGVVHTSKIHDCSIRALAIQGNRMVSTSSDMTVKIWDLSESIHKPQHTLEGHTGSVISMQLAKDRIITGSLDSTIKIWDFSSPLKNNNYHLKDN
ncbi:hypothetical protein CYY_000041 [Polysphondylium violaceum]|uniref:F-box domain-containing protein n=1 Tax=Polysphondylium violaceum TaxID=133409 RepID=A0A8J4Q4I8_9MYCE|nr:hypothetical protein CYY_000041 [Polysphondylium violaceum]